MFKEKFIQTGNYQNGSRQPGALAHDIRNLFVIKFLISFESSDAASLSSFPYGVRTIRALSAVPEAAGVASRPQLSAFSYVEA